MGNRRLQTTGEDNVQQSVAVNVHRGRAAGVPSGQLRAPELQLSLIPQHHVGFREVRQHDFRQEVPIQIAQGHPRPVAVEHVHALLPGDQAHAVQGMAHKGAGAAGTVRERDSGHDRCGLHARHGLPTVQGGNPGCGTGRKGKQDAERAQQGRKPGPRGHPEGGSGRHRGMGILHRSFTPGRPTAGEWSS